MIHTIASHIHMLLYFVGFTLQHKHMYRNMRVRLALMIMIIAVFVVVVVMDFASILFAVDLNH